MRMGKIFWRLFLLLCAVTGCIAGYGVDNLIGEMRMGELAEARLEELQAEKENPDTKLWQPEKEEMLQPEIIPIAENRPVAETQEMSGIPIVNAKDNTSDQKVDGVFFNVHQEKEIAEGENLAAEAEKVIGQDSFVASPEPMVPQEAAAKEKEDSGASSPMKLSAVLTGAQEEAYLPESTQEIPEEKQIELELSKEEPKAVITYPAEIFGQTPIVNRNDEYMTYFEFVLDLMEMVQPKIKARGLNEAVLIAKFTAKALVYGVDVSRIKINAPIPRSQAALALWIAAQVMEEKGTDTTTAQGMAYASDLGRSSAAIKKAVAYLYRESIATDDAGERGRFSPEKHLSEIDGTQWIAQAKRCWN